MGRRVAQIGRSVIVYDDSLVSHIAPELFDPASWPGVPTAPGYSGGRGDTLFISHSGQDWVLRHYHRGGFMSRWLTDQFLWTGLERSRPWREWALLADLAAMNLPSPQPVAGRVFRRGPVYSADLVTVRIPDVVPLSTRLAAGPLAESVWRAVGAMIAQFHDRRVFHADLTAHNIQIDSKDKLFLLDFDRGRIMPAQGVWSQQNLDRLHRSLTKISRDGGIGFSATEWDLLMAGYRA